MMNWKKYWDERYRAQGKRTVGNVALDEEGFREVTERVGKVIREKVGHLLKEKIVLDFGCGFGRNIPVLLEFALIVYGIDVSKWAIQEAAEYEPMGIYNLYDGSSIPFQDGFFEAIFCWTILQHIPEEEIEKVAKEILRVLSPEGYLIAYENVSTWREDKSHIWFRDVPTYCKLFDQCELISGRVISDFDNTQEKEAHCLMVFQKRLPGPIR